MVGGEQIHTLLEDEVLPFNNQLCVEVADSSYSKPVYLCANHSKPNLVSIVRVRSNRIFYRQPEATGSTVRRGHPTWYGARFSLQDAATWHTPDEKVTTTFTSHKKRVYRVEIEAWYNLLMRGESQPDQRPMQKYPFTLVHICLYRENGESVYANPMWLIVTRERRHELRLEDIFFSYNQRYALEHFFRFGKQRLLLDRYQTPEVRHEENWWHLVHLAYLQLWVARRYAGNLPRPWERYLPEMKDKSPSPAMVQRNFGEIIRQFGTPAGIPKRRGYSPGCIKGKVPVLRSAKPVVFQRRI
jgi:hypothetical protein